MSNVVALRQPTPVFDACTIAGYTHIMPGFFVALGPPTGKYAGKYFYGRLGDDAIPRWANRIHLNDVAYQQLIGVVKPDAPEQGAAPVANGR